MENQKKSTKDVTELDKVVEEFKKQYAVSRSIYWDRRCGKFCPRAYSATITAGKANDALGAFKRSLASN